MQSQSLLLTLSIVSLASTAAWAQPTFGPEIEGVRTKISKANHCVSKSDCARVKTQRCPYGCAILVHRRQVLAIDQLLSKAPQPCQFTCPGPGYFKAKKMACEQKRCVWGDSNSAKKATPAQLKQIKARQQVLARILALRQHVQKFKGHAARLRSKLEPIERKMTSGKNPDHADYATLTRIEQKYMIFEVPKNSK